eukprot:3484143-Alexandrium_andersonii.AAC.1
MDLLEGEHCRASDDARNVPDLGLELGVSVVQERTGVPRGVGDAVVRGALVPSPRSEYPAKWTTGPPPC